MCDTKNRNTGSSSSICRKQHILPKDMTNLAQKYSFARLLMVKGEKNVMEKIISSMYKDNMQIRKERDLFAFYKVDLLLL